MARSLRLEEFSDRELLMALEDEADEEGWTTAGTIAEAINLSHDNPNQCVGARLAWLNRYGIMEHDLKKGWRLNPTGDSLLHGSLSKTQRRQIEAVAEDGTLPLTELITERLRSASLEAAQLMRRQWRYGQAQRSRW